MFFFENKNSLFHVRKHKGGWFNRHRCFARDKERSKGKRNHDRILKQFYTHRHSIQCLVQLSPPPMPFFLAGKCYVSSLWSYSKDTIRAGCDNGKGGIVAVLRQRPREKFRFVSGSGFFFTVASLNRVRACVYVCGRACTVGVPRSTNRLSMYAWVISNGMETEAGGNKGDGEAVNIISLGIIRYYRASPLRQITRGRGCWIVGWKSRVERKKILVFPTMWK